MRYAVAIARNCLPFILRHWKMCVWHGIFKVNMCEGLHSAESILYIGKWKWINFAGEQNDNEVDWVATSTHDSFDSLCQMWNQRFQQISLQIPVHCTLISVVEWLKSSLMKLFCLNEGPEIPFSRMLNVHCMYVIWYSGIWSYSVTSSNKQTMHQLLTLLPTFLLAMDVACRQ